MAKGILANYYWCSGCHVCELACEKLYGFAPGVGGIVIDQIGPEQKADGTWVYDFVPSLTNRCSLCATRLSAGKEPTCVQHCQANCLRIVGEREASELMEGREKVVFLRP